MSTSPINFYANPYYGNVSYHSLTGSTISPEQAPCSGQWTQGYGMHNGGKPFAYVNMNDVPYQNGYQFNPPNSLNFSPPEELVVKSEELRDDKLRKYREKREKRQYQRDVSSKRSEVAQTRVRDENGLFIKSKKGKTAKSNDLQDRLMNTEDENKRLKEALASQIAEMEYLKQQLSHVNNSRSGCGVQENTYQQNSCHSHAQSHQQAHPSSYDPSYLEQYYEFKKRAELQKKMESEMSGNPLFLNQVSMLSPVKSNRWGGPPSYIYNENPPWHQDHTNPAFAEKIDYSTVHLKPTGEPPSKVDLARMEAANAQRQMINSQILRYGMHLDLTSEHIDYYHDFQDPYIHPGDPLTPKMMTAFEEKVDLRSEISKLRQTPNSPGISPMSYDDDFFDEDMI